MKSSDDSFRATLEGEEGKQGLVGYIHVTSDCIWRDMAHLSPRLPFPWNLGQTRTPRAGHRAQAPGTPLPSCQSSHTSPEPLGLMHPRQCTVEPSTRMHIFALSCKGLPDNRRRRGVHHHLMNAGSLGRPIISSNMHEEMSNQKRGLGGDI